MISHGVLYLLLDHRVRITQRQPEHLSDQSFWGLSSNSLENGTRGFPWVSRLLIMGTVAADSLKQMCRGSVLIGTGKWFRVCQVLEEVCLEETGFDD